MSTTPNLQQAAAIAARGRVFVAAGAGTGKTTVLVERFVRAVLEEGLDVESLLVITYTERAAAELRARIRARLVEVGRPDLARALDGAWISTIHGFCRRVLIANALAAGIDPGFRVLGDAQARVLQGEAFDEALARFCATDDEARWALLGTYGRVGLRTMMRSVYETLRSAGRALELEPGDPADLSGRVDELRSAAETLARDRSATDLQRGAAAAALELIDESTLPERLLALADLRPRGARAAAFNEARTAVHGAALEELAARDRELLQELLNAFADAYAEGKARESALDFEDLQLLTRDVLRADPEVRTREQLRFRAVMVDEFQDTNRLQADIIDLLTEPTESQNGRGSNGHAVPALAEVFLVGDEFQSIYGFRHADVAVFRERRDAAPEVLPLTLNYRSRPEVLDVVNELFSTEFGEGFLPLESGAGPATPSLRSAVELLVTDKAAVAAAGGHWRRSEARAVARRVREVVDSGVATAGEIVLLFAAGTDAEWYEEELRAQGLPTIRAAGRSYFGQQQVVDLIAYLRLLQNRYDDEALLTVLAAPFVGVSNDALVLIRAAAQRQPLFRGIERSLPEQLGDDDRRLVLAFLQRYERLVAQAGQIPLELLCERILTEHDYDLAVLACHDGRRRYANLRKLARLARSYEEVRGPDLEGFVRFIAEQEAVGARELDAVSEEEGADAVRLLTIHAAKGLEFKVVVVADAGRDRQRPDDILCLSDGRFGFKVAHPLTGKRETTSTYHGVKGAQERAEEAERLRLYYVAMTRAMDRLIVSGSVDLAIGTPETTPIRWVLDRLGLIEAVSSAGAAPVEVERGSATVVLRVDRGAEPISGDIADNAESTVVAQPADDVGQLELFSGVGEALPRRAPRLRALASIPEPSAARLRRLSYSGISLFERCSYRFYAERVVGMRPAPWSHAPMGADAIGLHVTEIGDAAHRLLELVPFDAPARPEGWVDLVKEWYPSVADGELARIGAFVDAYLGSSLARRLRALTGVRAERPFAFELDGVVLNGRLDVLWRDAERALVVDFKTNALHDRDPGVIVESEYRAQRTVYALACLRSGSREVEVAYQFLEAPDDLVLATFSELDLPTLEAELSRTVARIRGGDFRPSPSPFACSGCPALDVVCGGPALAGFA